MTNCFCGSSKPYSSCCEPYISGKQVPKDAESLMRSRYSAYAQAKIAYIVKTMRGKAAIGFDRKDAKAWATDVTWLELKVLSSTQQSDTRAQVEFVAYYLEEGSVQQIHELSDFECINQQWFYIDGEILLPIKNI